MHPAAHMYAMRKRLKNEPELTELIADALGWEAIEVSELLAGDFDPLPSEVKLISRAIAAFDRDVGRANRVRHSVVG